MIRSASGTYSLPSACMKSYWVSTSQKMTRAMAGNLSDDTGACQQQGGRTKPLPVPESEDDRDDVFLDVPAEIVVAARQQVAGLNVRSHEGFELRHVRQHRFPQRHAVESRTPCSLLPEDG